MVATLVTIFIIGYACIALEHPLKVNKTATALLLGVLTWSVYNMFNMAGGVDMETYRHFVSEKLIENLGETAEFDGTALEAYKKLETAVMANKDNKNANYYLQLCYRYMANYYLKQGQNDLSKTYFTKWLELDPNNEHLRKYVEGLNQPQQ